MLVHFSLLFLSPAESIFEEDDEKIARKKSAKISVLKGEGNKLFLPGGKQPNIDQPSLLENLDDNSELLE